MFSTISYGGRMFLIRSRWQNSKHQLWFPVKKLKHHQCQQVAKFLYLHNPTQWYVIVVIYYHRTLSVFLGFHYVSFPRSFSLYKCVYLWSDSDCSFKTCHPEIYLLTRIEEKVMSSYDPLLISWKVNFVCECY